MKMWSWQNLLAAEYLLSLFIVERLQLCKLIWSVNPFQPQSSPWGEEQLLWGVWALCGLCQHSCKSAEERLHHQGKTARDALMQLLYWGRTKNLKAVWAAVFEASQRPKLKPWMVLWLFIMSSGTFIAQIPIWQVIALSLDSAFPWWPKEQSFTGCWREKGKCWDRGSK